MNDCYTLAEPIVALATPHGRSALCILRLSGSNICQRVSTFFSRPSALSSSHNMAYGFFLDAAGNALDEVMACCFYAPRSYTGEDVIELYTHGNMHLVQQMLESLYLQGFRPALPGEFTYRATMLGKMDMLKAEAIHELIVAKSRESAKLALGRLTGQLAALLNPIYAQLIEVSSYLRMHLDYPQDEVEPLPHFDLGSVQQKLNQLLHNSRHLTRWTNGATVVIAGAPNAGKSSLFNLLLQQDRALVSSTPGTTRDYLQAEIQLGGFPISLIDTAGLRDSQDSLESLGIEKTLSLFAGADLILHIVEIGELADLLELAPYQEKVLTVMNKSDLGSIMEGQLAISVLKNEGIEPLIDKILEKLDFSIIAQQNEFLMLGSLRQLELCRKAMAHIDNFVAHQETQDLDMMSFDIHSACGALSTLLGKNLDQEVNIAMFSQFCLGK